MDRGTRDTFYGLTVRAFVAALLALASFALAAAQAAPEQDEDADESPTSTALPAPADGARLVAADATWSYVAFVAPPLTRQLGASTLAALDAVHGRKSRAQVSDSAAAARPGAWPAALPANARRGPAPLGAAGPGGKCQCMTSVVPATQLGGDQRVVALLATSRFTAPAQPAPLLELRVRYRDGIAVWINGTEVMRRSLTGAALWQAADRPRGPEWETAYLQVTPGLLRRGDNLVAVEVRPSSSSAAPLLALELYARQHARIVRGPMVQAVGDRSAQLAVETDIATAATLRWGKGGQLTAQLASPSGRRHVFTLRDLPANQAISYQISAGASQTPVHVFHTLPPPGATLRLGVYGDVRGGHEVHRRLTEALLEEAPDAVLVTGDMVLRGSDEGDWQRFFAVTSELLPRVPYYPAIGNHDLGRAGEAGRRADQIFALPPGPPGRPEGAFWYSVDLADVHLVFLDSNAYERVEQERWLEADLAAARARKVRAIIALTHDGPFSRGIHRGSPLARTRYLPILARHKVALLLSGHDHQYQRGRAGGVDYVVTGGGGAPLYPVSCGVPGKPRCAVDDGMRKVAKEFHYVMLTLTGSTLELCARRADRSALEPCQRLRL